MDKFASFDLEIAKEIPEGCADWRLIAPLGISCAAVMLTEVPEVRYWYNEPQMSKDDAAQMVHEFCIMESQGYRFVTWNGCGFDFAVLAQESGLVEECAELALNHIDLMLNVTFLKGHYLGLDAALAGAGLAGKKHNVTLKDGTVMDSMSGALAPALWAKGETEAVLEYLHDDVEQPLQLVNHIIAHKGIFWTTRSGRRTSVFIDKLRTVKECFALPEPDVSWMSSPPTREQFVDWIPNWKEKLDGKN
jgi:hypothetical protein